MCCGSFEEFERLSNVKYFGRKEKHMIKMIFLSLCGSFVASVICCLRSVVERSQRSVKVTLKLINYLCLKG